MKVSKLYYAIISGGFGKCGMCQKKMYMLGVRETKELRKKKKSVSCVKRKKKCLVSKKRRSVVCVKRKNQYLRWFTFSFG